MIAEIAQSDDDGDVLLRTQYRYRKSGPVKLYLKMLVFGGVALVLGARLFVTAILETNGNGTGSFD